MNNIYKLFTIGLGILILVSCGKNPAAPEYQQEIAIFGFLWGNKPLNSEHAIMISYTQPIDAYYDLNNAAIQNANVTIEEISTGEKFVLKESNRAGFYFNDSLIIKPQGSYQLQVAVDNKVVTGTTIVPPMLYIETELSTDKVDSVYQNLLSVEKPIFLSCESNEQIVVVDVYCNESWQNAEYINPFWGQEKPTDASEYGGQDGNSEPRHITAVAKFKELISDNFWGRYVIDWYAAMIGFYGSYTLQVMAIDDNYYNFINHNEYPELRGGIDGGVGVFGSVCGETYRLFILKPNPGK